MFKNSQILTYIGRLIIIINMLDSDSNIEFFVDTI